KQILSGSRPVWESSPKVKNLVSTRSATRGLVRSFKFVFYNFLH
ncbi:unnamed protein product, partial [Rotaria socialis]